MERGIKNLVFNSLGAKGEDNVVLIHDNKHAEPANIISEFLKNNKISCRVLLESSAVKGISYEGLSEKVRELLLNQEKNIFIFLLSYSIWHTPERKKAKYELGKRLAQIICDEKDFASSCCLIDIKDICELSDCLKKFFRKKSIMHISSNNGTDLTTQIGNSFIETGDYTEYGSGGEFPPGEIGFGPIEGSTNGKLVYNLKVQHLGRVNNGDLIITVKNDEVTEIAGNKKDEFLKLLSINPILYFISEVSLGINPMINCDLDDIHHIKEEKKLGTIHFGHGGTASYGNRNGPHFDCVISQPSVKINSVDILRSGEINEGILSEKTLLWLKGIENKNGQI